MNKIIIIEFWIRQKKVTWFIDNNYLGIFAFLISLMGGFIYRWTKYKALKPSPPIKKLRAGSHLSDCIDPESAYEVIHPDLKKVIYHMLDFKENLPVVLPISAPIIFVANAALSRQIATQLSILGVKTVITNVKDASLRTALGFLAGLGVVILNNPPAFIGGGLVLVVFSLNLHFGGIRCENFVHKLPEIA